MPVTQDQQWLVVGGAVMLGMLCLSVYRRRDFIRGKIRYMLAVALACVLTFWIASQYMDPVKAMLVMLLVEAVVINRWRPVRSRYVSRRDRRKVVARFERSGERYDPKKHEIDHVVPHSRGGQSTADNLRVISRARNRSKSDKAPWWDVLGK